VRQLVDFGDDLDKREDGKVRRILVLMGYFVRCVLCCKILHIFVFPHEQECISYVFVGCSSILVYLRMSNFSDLVHKEHDFSLQNFSGVCKVSDVAKAEHRKYSLPGHHGVDITARAHILSNNLRTGLSKANGEQMPNFHDCLFQHGRLKLGISFFLLASLLFLSHHGVNTSIIYLF
jgi:hypothetical protein